MMEGGYLREKPADACLGLGWGLLRRIAEEAPKALAGQAAEEPPRE